MVFVSAFRCMPMLFKVVWFWDLGEPGLGLWILSSVFAQPNVHNTLNSHSATSLQAEWLNGFDWIVMIEQSRLSSHVWKVICEQACLKSDDRTVIFYSRRNGQVNWNNLFLFSLILIISKDLQESMHLLLEKTHRSMKSSEAFFKIKLNVFWMLWS